MRGDKHGVDTRVFINSLGLPTYEAKELGLAEKEFSEFGEIDKCIHVVGPEQASFFKTTFKAEELLDNEEVQELIETQREEMRERREAEGLGEGFRGMRGRALEETEE